MAPEVSPVLPTSQSFWLEQAEHARWDVRRVSLRFSFFPGGHLNAAAAVSLSMVLNQPPVQHQGQKPSRTSALRLLRISNPGVSLRCALHELLSNCSTITSVVESTACLDTPAQCLENGNIQTYRVISEPIGRFLCGSCAAGYACSAAKPRCSCRRWTKRGGQLSWVRLFLSCRQLSCARTDGVQCTTTVLLSCWDLYTKHTRACTSTHKHTQNKPRLAHFYLFAGQQAWDMKTLYLSSCLCLFIYLSRWSWIWCLSRTCWSNTVYFRSSHNSWLLNDSSYPSIQTFWTFTRQIAKSVNLEREKKLWSFDFSEYWFGSVRLGTNINCERCSVAGQCKDQHLVCFLLMFIFFFHYSHMSGNSYHIIT